MSAIRSLITIDNNLERNNYIDNFIDYSSSANKRIPPRTNKGSALLDSKQSVPLILR